MAVYIVRRLIAAFFILIGASFIVYMLMTQAGDPLAFTNEITNPTQRAGGAPRPSSRRLNLDVHPVAALLPLAAATAVRGRLRPRVGDPAAGLGRAAAAHPADAQARRPRRRACRSSSASASASSPPSASTRASTTSSRSSRSCSSPCPVFWVAVILKAWGGINFNDWLRDGAHFSVDVHRRHVGRRGGHRLLDRRRAMAAQGRSSAPLSGRRVAGAAVWISSHQWLLDPGFGPSCSRSSAVGIAVGVVAVMAGWRNAEARNTALVTAGDRHRAVVPAAGAVRRRRQPLDDLRARRRRRSPSASPSATWSAASTRASRRAPARSRRC